MCIAAHVFTAALRRENLPAHWGSRMQHADVFLSYNREDKAVARQFAESFEALGIRVWWDVALRSGETYDVVTETALREARAVVVLWSKNPSPRDGSAQRQRWPTGWEPLCPP